MPTLHIEEPRLPVNPKGFALFALGFRPFFLAAGLTAIVLQLIWVGVFAKWWEPTPYYGLTGWHSHEMLFGYTTAVIAGFLLTAVRNWTQSKTPTGTRLGLLCLLWLLGRIAPFLDQTIPATLIALVDLSFLPILALSVGIPLVKARQPKNLVFLIILGLLTLANLLIHLDALGVTQGMSHSGTYFGVMVIILLIVIMGGRVIPFFTERAVQGFKARSWPFIEWGGLVSVLAFALSTAFNSQLLILYSGVSAFLFQGIRLAGWMTPAAWKNPILWVLHIGYAWLVLGFLLFALQGHWGINQWVGLHAFTTGAIGMITLGMMARVALGHTARMMQAPAIISWGFGILALATVLRVCGPWLEPAQTTVWIILSSLLWILSFALFAIVYMPILIRPRVDGRPG
jgi:uncharacterized protein involved in response to NO